MHEGPAGENRAGNFSFAAWGARDGVSQTSVDDHAGEQSFGLLRFVAACVRVRFCCVFMNLDLGGCRRHAPLASFRLRGVLECLCQQTSTTNRIHENGRPSSTSNVWLLAIKPPRP